MLKFYKKIISDDTADAIYHAIMGKFFKDPDRSYEHKNPATNFHSFGFMNVTETFIEIERIKNIIREDFGDGYEFTHTYSRIYPDNSILNPHIDREGLDLTLTVNVFNNPDNRWPILFSKVPISKELINDIESTIGYSNTSYTILKEYLDDYETIITNKGDGACCTREVVHWRERFKIKYEGEHYVQVFYHWKKI